MAISKNGLTIFALLVTLIILETGNVIEFPSLPVHFEEEHLLPHTREKRNVLTDQWNYIVDVVVNASSVETIERIQSSLKATILPVKLDNNTDISDISITTVCSSAGTGFQCRCEEQFAWPYNSCVTYGACDHISNGICKCINAIPADGQTCKPISELLAQVEYTLDVELNVTDVQTVDHLRSVLNNGSFSLALGPTVNVTHIDITTVCYPNGTTFQCRCEEQYVWSYNNCITDGACDEIDDDTCGCINSRPSNGKYCEPKKEAVQLYEYMLEVEISIGDIALIEQIRDAMKTISFPVRLNNTINITQIDIIFTAPTVLNEYIISVELNISDDAVINKLRTILRNITSPISINNHIQISDANMTTVCSPSSGDDQCRCEDQYRWSCDQCLKYGPCDNITDDTCGCINGIPPDGQYCQSVHQHNFRACPVATPSPSPTTVATVATTQNTTLLTPTPTVITGIDVEMSIRLDKEYTADLSDTSSPAYREFEGQVQPVLEEQYRGITGFVKVFVKAFSEGSIVTDFVVEATEVIPEEIGEANAKLVEAMGTIAPVIGSVAAYYNSPTPISFPDLTYTGSTMTLTCGPPKNIDVGQISGSQWKFKNREIKSSERIKITDSSMISMLTVNNVILADIGLYECTLKGGVIYFKQEGLVTGNEIRQAPNVQVKSKVNVKCTEGQTHPLQCCVQSPYKVKWFEDTTVVSSVVTEEGGTYCIKHDYQLGSCTAPQPEEKSFICKVDKPEGYSGTTLITIFRDDITCNDAQYGAGREGDESSIGCEEGQEGRKTAECLETGEWKLIEDTCIVTEIKELLIYSQDLVEEEVPQFVKNLSETVKQDEAEIADSSATISAIVDILDTIANISTEVDESVMLNVLQTVDVIISDDARESWAVLNANETRNSSSKLLGSLETLSDVVVGEFGFSTQRILFNRTTFDNSFRADLNSSIVLEIPDTNISNVFISTITFSSLYNVMPARNSSFDASPLNATSNETVTDNAINAGVVLIKINATIQNVTLSYNKLNNSLSLNPQCVFWNFTLFDNLGAWDDEGCMLVSDINNTVTCSCNHLTSFSLLMATDIPQDLKEALDIITYVGVGISLASLVICLVIEGFVWKAITRNSTAFMRHVSIINTALSLLIADICFLIAASIAKNPLENPGEDYEVPLGPCSTATFFMHFFYLALFFWMLVSGLLLFYRTVMVFSHMSKSTMLAIGFCLGYGCPLIIAVITVAVTAPGNGYIRRTEACWLNWMETKALLALVIPALSIVFINIFIVIVVLFKMLRRGVGDAAQTDEKHTLVVIARCVIILTPLFGLTWSLGVGTMVSSTNKGIHIAFAFFNSLQGFFILVFGTLLDSKIRSLLTRKLPTPSTTSNQTRSVGLTCS